MHDYYKDRGIRDICHGVKERELECMKIMADFFINQDVISKNSIIIPAPQHEGCAIYTKIIADIVAAETNATVMDILKTRPRQTLYEQKKKGRIDDLYFYLTDSAPKSGDIWFLDNVIATGTTFNAANRLFGGMLKPLIFAQS